MRVPVIVTVVEEDVSGLPFDDRIGGIDSYVLIMVVEGEHMGATGVGCAMDDAYADLAHNLKAESSLELTLACLGRLEIRPSNGDGPTKRGEPEVNATLNPDGYEYHPDGVWGGWNDYFGVSSR